MGEYQYRAYPAAKYHYTGNTIVVKNPEEDAALGGGWADRPNAFDPYKGPRRLGPQHDPVKWVDQWSVEGLSEGDRKKIKAQLLKAHAAFWKRPDAPNADSEAMRLAFDGVARVLFETGLLNEQPLAKEIPELVWDSAIAGGWWRLASDTPQKIFPERLGRYWVWRDDSRNWNMLFTAEASEWQARLLEASASVSDPTEPPKAHALRKRAKSAAMRAGSAPARWQDVEISFLSDERVQISIGEQRETFNYAEMGFDDQRNGTPSRSWILLRGLAQNQGMIPETGRGAKGWAAIEKQIERTRKLLQSHFGILEDPLPFVKGVGYRLGCKIWQARSFDS